MVLRHHAPCRAHKDKAQQIIDLLRSSPITETRLNFISNLKHPVAGVHFLCILEDILE
jgi:hypothetical protein